MMNEDDQIIYWLRNKADLAVDERDEDLFDEAVETIERLHTRVSDLSLTLMVRDSEMDKLLGLITAWADAEYEISVSGPYSYFEACDALRKAVGR